VGRSDSADRSDARATVSVSCSDYRTTDLSKIGERFDAAYDTATTMTTAVGLSLLRKDGVFLDIHPTRGKGKFIRSIFNRRLKRLFCTPRSDILDGLARAAKEGKPRLLVAEVVLLSKAIRLVTARQHGGQGPVVMD
jgi:NADPH:quinone reductase-like Zn-dependent oxidoreductase